MVSQTTLFDELNVTDDQWRLFVQAGFCYLNLNRFKEAGEIFQGLISLNPNQDVGHIGLGNVYFAQKRLAEAAKEHEKAIELNPKSALAKAHHAEVLLFKKEKEEAVAELKEAVALDPQGFTAAFARSLLEAVKKGVFD